MSAPPATGVPSDPSSALSGGHRLPTWALPAGALLAAVAVGAGAFGAHGLRGRLDVRSLELWETAARYLMYGAFGLVALGIAARTPGAATSSARAVVWRAAAYALAGGVVVFVATVAALALGGPRALGAVTPLGGLGMIAGFALFAWAARGVRR